LAGTPSASRSSVIIAVGLGLIYLLQCVAFIQTQSLTFDEPVHIAEGLNAWRHHTFAMWNDHPPLARLWCTLSLLNPRWQMDVAPLSNGGWQVERIEPDPERIAHRARYMNVVFGLILAWLLWTTVRRMFSAGAANLALALFVFSPALVAHFSVATTDGAATLFVFLSAAYLIRWRQSPGLLRTTAMGTILGLLLLVKFSTPVIFVLAVLWMLVLKPGGFVTNPVHFNWGKTAAAVVVAFLVVWAGYRFHVSHLSLHSHQLIATFPNRSPVVFNNVRSNLDLNLFVPAGEYLEGFRNVVRRNRLGQPSFFLGQVSQSGGFRSYYPVAILLKWPVITLILFVAGLALAIRHKRGVPSGLWVMASFPAVYFSFAIFARYNIGDRHVLPVYPFMLLFAGGVWEVVRLRRALAAVIVLAVVSQFVDTLRYAPDYLSYFNFFVQPRESYRFLSDSNLDWGQGLLALKEYERSHPHEQISLAYFGSIDPRFYGIRARPLAENEKATGTVIVSATQLSGQYLKEPESYQWLLSYPITQVLDHSLFVFRVAPPLEWNKKAEARPLNEAKPVPAIQLGYNK
jgi:hypothetical protein